MLTPIEGCRDSLFDAVGAGGGSTAEGGVARSGRDLVHDRGPGHGHRRGPGHGEAETMAINEVNKTARAEVCQTLYRLCRGGGRGGGGCWPASASPMGGGAVWTTESVARFDSSTLSRGI